MFVSISQMIGCEDRLRNDLHVYCVEWGAKLYSNQPTKPWAVSPPYVRQVNGMTYSFRLTTNDRRRQATEQRVSFNRRPSSATYARIFLPILRSVASSANCFVSCRYRPSRVAFICIQMTCSSLFARPPVSAAAGHSTAATRRQRPIQKMKGEARGLGWL